MYTGLKHLHSYFAYLVLFLLVVATLYFLYKAATNSKLTAADKKLSFFAMLTAHLQFVFGLILYFISPTIKQSMSNMGDVMGNTELRKHVIEHPVTMLIAIILFTIANSKIKKGVAAGAAAKWLPAILFLIGLALALYIIPWKVWLG